MLMVKCTFCAVGGNSDVIPHRAFKEQRDVDIDVPGKMDWKQAYLAEYKTLMGALFTFGGKFKNRDIIEFCGSKGIKREYSNARTPQQNGVAERKNRTLIEAARTMLADSFLPNTFWAEVVSTACYVLKKGVKSSKANNAGEEPIKHPELKSVDKEDQVFLEELERLKRQEQDANDATEALRKEFAQETEDLLLKAGAAKASSTNIVNTASIPVSTASPYGGLFLHDSNQLLTKMIQIIPALDGNFLGGQSYCATKEGNIIGLPALFILLVSCLENEPRSSLKHFEMKVGLMLCSLGRLPAKLRLVERGVVYTNEIPEALVKDEEASDVDVHLYRSMIGSLMYLTASRPDIMFAVCACSRVSLILNGSYSGCDYDGAILDWKSTSGEFHEIIDFLAQSSIHNALTWKPMSISEASIRSDLLFDDANGIDSLPNQAIFDVIQLMGYEGDLTLKRVNNLGKVTPLFASMLVQPTEDEDATSERPSEPQPTLSPPYPSKANVEPQSDPSPRPSPTTHILDSIPEDSGGKCYQGGLD
ncbi:putative ribonuclease H-like domain-containing protein [Tanacetum coccineum]